MSSSSFERNDQRMLETGRLRLSMESYASTRMRPVNHSPTRASQRAVIHRVEPEYKRFGCISDMHKFGVKVQQVMWTKTSAEIISRYGLFLFRSCVSNEHQGPNARESFAKQNSAPAMKLTSRLTVEVWRCSKANQAGTLLPVCLSTLPTAVDANEAHGQRFADYLWWVFLQVDP